MNHSHSTSNPFPLFDKLSANRHEQVIYGVDDSVGLRAVVALHSTRLGPALGGVRLLNYAHESEALEDVLRLSEGMTYKAALAGLPLGGGKAVILSQGSLDTSPDFWKAYGKFVETLSGRYITAPDVNTTMHDMVHIAQSTRHVVGLPVDHAGSGDPSIMTSYGVYVSIKAALQHVYGTDDLTNRKIGVEGLGKVGSALVERLSRAGASVYAFDVDGNRLAAVSQQHDIEAVGQDVLYAMPLDVYAPCALGGTLNNRVISQLRCAAVVGAANNQLADEALHSHQLLERGIVHVPDFLANAGGVINAYTECDGYSRVQAKERTERIYDTCIAVLKQAVLQQAPPHMVAKQMALQKIFDASQVSTSKRPVATA